MRERNNAIYAPLVKYVDLDNPGVKERMLGIPAIMGSGKTTEIIRYVAKNCKYHGCIIAVERLADGRQLKERIDEQASMEICYVLVGWSETVCRFLQGQPQEFKRQKEKLQAKGIRPERMCLDCQYKRCPSRIPDKYYKAQGYPVLIIMHQRLTFALENPAHMGQLRKWQRIDYLTLNGRTREAISAGDRPILLIDEKPNLVLTDTVKVATIRKLWDKQRYRKKCSYRRAVKFLFNVAQQGQTQFDPMKSPVVFNEYEKATKKLIEKLCRYGGYIHWDDQHPDQSVFMLAHPLRLELPGVLRTVVFDGTMVIDPYYDLFAWKAIPIAFPRQATIRLHCMPKQQYKNSFIKLIESDPDLVEKRIRILAKRHRKVLVVTTKYYEDDIEAMQIHGVKVVHYRALKGRNDLRNHKAVYFTHIYQGPIHAYRSLVKAAGHDRDESFGKLRRDSYSFGFHDPLLEAVRVRSILADLIQDIYRLKVREGWSVNGLNDVDVYIGLTDPLIMNWLCRGFPNVVLMKEKGL